MTEVPESTTSTPIVTALRNFQRMAEGHLSRNIVTRDSVQSWSSRIRMQLSKLLGPEGTHVEEFSLLPDRLSPADARSILEKRLAHLGRLIQSFEVIVQSAASDVSGNRVFIGHGRSPLWRELKDFISERLKLPWDEFNRTPVAGISTSARLESMLRQSTFAFLVMTAEEEHADATFHARDNVIHEVGLFQGRLSFHKAIVLLEDGCAEFSNIVGLSQIRFPRGDIAARFEDVRAVLEREGLV